MSVATETTTVYDVLALARRLSASDRHWLAELLGRQHDAPLQEHASIGEAIALYLMDACSLGRAAELSGVTRWDIQDRLRELGIPILAPGAQSAQEIDDLAEQLEREGIL